MTKKKIERHIEELYADDPERADAVVFGRRGFLRGAGVVALGAAVGASIPFARNMPSGLIPAALAQGAPATPPAAPAAAPAAPVGPKFLEFPGKDKLVVLGDRPLVAETPEALLDDDTTPTNRFFIRNNGLIPDAPASSGGWKVTVDGEVNTKLELTLDEIKARFPVQNLTMVLECGGNGRSQYVPAARGNQWTNGGAGCAKWTGVRLKDLLQAAGPKSTAIYTGHYGADPHLSTPGAVTLSRGVPMAKAMEDHSLVVWAMNDQPLSSVHGAPVRLVIPGWPGSVSAKWLNRIWVREKEHDGAGMAETSYRVPIAPMVPGAAPNFANFKIMESMPVRSITTNPANGGKLPAGTREITVRGKAWAGDLTVRQVDVSVDYGATWTKADLQPVRNRYDWHRWTAKLRTPLDGYYEIWSRATDSNGTMQPHVAANWNPQGYGGNALHRVAVLIGT
ncbi:MAG: molybdopterin containing oxidoreductase [Alphaproteobacteria bacterium]|nr:molybdopterin containing oxidoreductase [Alphaproteobacteria bacterium]